MEAEQAFSTDLGYYEDRAAGFAGVAGVTADEARRDLAARHGFLDWDELVEHVGALRDGREPPSPFVLAYRALEARDEEALRELLDAHPELVRQRGTNGNDLLGLAGGAPSLVRLLLERGADVNRGNDYGWTILHQAGYGNDRPLAGLALEAGADPGLSARGDGGTPLVVALFWGHREVVGLLGERAAEPARRGGARPRRPDRRAGRDAGGRRCTARSTGRTAAFRSGSRATIRRRSWTRRSSGLRRAIGSRRSRGWPSSALASTRIPTAGRHSRGRR